MGPWEVARSWGWSPKMGSVPFRDPRELCHPLCHMRTQWENSSATKKEGAHQKPLHAGTLISDFSLRNCEKETAVFFSSLLVCGTWLEQLEWTNKTVLCRLQGPPCRGGQGILLRTSPSSRSGASEWGRDPLPQWHRVVPVGSRVWQWATQRPHPRHEAAESLSQARGWPAAGSESTCTPFPRGVSQVFTVIGAMRTGWWGSSPLPGVAQITHSWAYQHRQSPGDQRNRRASDAGCIPQPWHWGPTCNAPEYLE